MLAQHTQSPGFDPQYYRKLGTVVCACRHSTLGVEAAGSEGLEAGPHETTSNNHNDQNDECVHP